MLRSKPAPPAGWMVSLMAVALVLLGAPRAAQAQASADLQALIDHAVRDRQPVVKLPSGVIRLPKGLVVEKAEGLTIDGAGTTLVIGDIRTPAIDVMRSRKVVLRGVTIDYDPLPFTQGTVVSRSADGSQVEFEVHAGYPDLTEPYLQKQVHVFDATRPLWKRLAPDVYANDTEALTPRRGRLNLPINKPWYDQLQPGDRIVLNNRGSSAIRFWQSEDVRVEGATLHAGGMGVVCRYMRGDNRFQFDIRPGALPAGATQPRLFSTSADGFNYAFARRGPVLEKSHFSFMGDDSVNLHGPVLLVTRIVSPTEMLVATPWGPEPVDWLVEPGDTARRLQKNNYAILREATIASFAREGKAEGEQAELVRSFWPRVKSKSGPTLYRVVLREPLEAQVGEVLDIPSISAPGFRISNCEFSDHRARGLVICSSNGVIENNTFRRIKRLAIKLDPGYAFWREAGWVRDVTARGNLIEDMGACPDTWAPKQYVLGAISVGGQQEDPKAGLPYRPGNGRITIENNVIRGCSVAGIYVRCADEVTIRGNQLSQTMYVNAPEAGAEQGVTVKEPIDIQGNGMTIEDNEITEVGVAPAP